jgi:GNAT superfamily N-acetyltransferase
MNWLQKIAKSEALQALVDKWKSAVPGLLLYVYEDENRIVLSNIIVPKGQRKQGFGSQVVQDLIDYADQIGKRMELSPGVKDPYQGTTSRNRLVQFYKRFGFLENRGRKKDYRMTETMFRDPSQKPTTDPSQGV